MTSPSDFPGPTPGSLRITDIGELIGVLPVLFGFRPVNSLVLVTDAGTRPSLLGGVVRVDLPAPHHIPPLVTQLCQVVTTAGATTVTIVVLGGTVTDSDSLPHRRLVDRLTTGLIGTGIQAERAVWASTTDSTGHWQCYDQCRCSGAVRDMRTSPMAAALTVAGATTVDSRDQLSAALAPDPVDQLERRAAMLDARLRAHPASDPAAHGDAAHRVVRDAIAAAADCAGLPMPGDEQVVALACALSDPDVRDRCLAAAVSDHADAAERLWTVLTRATPAPERAEPACLLAVHAYLRGNGALANIALDNALDANPDHTLAQLLQHAFGSGMPPAQLKRFLHQAITMAVAPNAPATAPGTGPTPR